MSCVYHAIKIQASMRLPLGMLAGAKQWVVNNVLSVTNVIRVVYHPSICVVVVVVGNQPLRY